MSTHERGSTPNGKTPEPEPELTEEGREDSGSGEEVAERDTPVERLDDENEEDLYPQVARLSYRGPLPPASEFKAYGDALEGAPERILSMAESSQAHSQSMQERALAADIEDQRADRIEARIGQFLGFALVALALVLGALSGGWFGTIIATTGGAGFLTALIKHLRGRSKPLSSEEVERQ